MLTALMVLLRSLGLICGGPPSSRAGKPRAPSTIGRADANGETPAAPFDGPTVLDPPRQALAGLALRLSRRAPRQELLQVVRSGNMAPAARQLRVLLGDPPIDWTGVHSSEDLSRLIASPEMDRDRHPAELIQREVLAKHRQALVIYGDRHFDRKPAFASSMVTLLEKIPARVFTIASPTAADLQTLQAGVAAWPRPSLTMLQGTAIGAAEVTAVYPPPMILRDGKWLAALDSTGDARIMPAMHGWS
jgi:hypothetical protein